MADDYDLLALIRRKKDGQLQPQAHTRTEGRSGGPERKEPPGRNKKDIGAADAAVVQSNKIAAHPPFVPYERTIEHHPKNWPTPPQIGDSVFYNGERYWITNAPSNWNFTSYVQIADKHVRPGAPIPKDTNITSVHADRLTPAPTRGASFEGQPSLHKLEVEKKKKELGITDIGDEIGEMLRGKTLPQIYDIGSEYLGVEEFVLMKRFSHLNNGQQRMQIGNWMRREWKKRHK